MASGYKELYRHKAIPELISSRVMENFGFALVSGVWSILFYKQGLSDGQIGILKGGAVIITLITSMMIPRILEKYDESKIFPLCIFTAGALTLLAGLPVITIITGVFLVTRVLNNLKSSAFSVMFRDSFRRVSVYTLAQGTLSGLIAFAWMIGPVMGGLIMDKFTSEAAMYTSGLILIIASVVAYIERVPHITEEVHSSLNIIQNIKYFTRIKGLKVAYIIRSGQDVWWSFIFTFLPLYMLQQNYSLFQIGTALGLTQLPLVLGEFSTLKSLRYLSFKSIFSSCFFTLLVLTIIAYFVNSPTVVIALLIFGSIPLAFLDPLGDVFFFSLTDKDEEERAYPIFITATSFGEGIFTLVLGLILTGIAFQYSFLVVAVFMLILLLTSLRITKVKPERTLE
ncbi:MAG: MFS transporter [Candidatus Nomurabacteria bacterium]|nr:MAG: MFS transporter [Candidatus Nomurabacteria bacterium]HRV75829.1 MFS transporter [Candidatus Saccharimonadales bacterium]